MASPDASAAEFDIIFAGGGTAAGVAAGRLAAADPTLRILLIETGPHTKQDLAHVQPARFFSHLLPDTITAKHVVSRPSEHLDGRQLVVQTGHCVGGGSSVNFTMYTRPAASDYDDWAKVYKNHGWSFDELLPLIRKVEKFQALPGKPTHGYDGALKASYGGYRVSVGQEYLDVVAKYDKARTFVEDANSMVDDVNHYQASDNSALSRQRIRHAEHRRVWPKWIDEETGRRSDVPHHFLYDKTPHNKNLQIVVGSTVKRVIIENGRAVGVEYVDNPRIKADADKTVRTARATRLVVVSAGTFGSPAILERSGIGAREVLARYGIEQVVDLPGVGENYNDHPTLFVPFLGAEGTVTLTNIMRGDQEEITMGEGRQGPYGDEWCRCRLQVPPNPDELKDIGPDFIKRWESFFAPSPDKAIGTLAVLAIYVSASLPIPEQPCFSTGGFLYYPEGVGSVHISSAEDVHAPPDFDSGVMSTCGDIAVLRHMYKRSREVGRRMASYRGEYVAGHPKFPEGSAAAVSAGPVAPVAVDAQDIVYTAEDDRAIDEHIKAHVITVWHSLGTCAMKPREEGGVVDSRLNVYGVQGLKVADMSIAPENMGTNTYSPALTIGEKAAVIIAEELGIVGV
ncbi:alcohol oxidase-like protein [Trametes maxima]|nr:alcohol oxidase-like protein [Trametes maxima]